MTGRRLDSSGSREGQVGDSREHSYERSGCIKCGWFLQLAASEGLCSMEFVCLSACQSVIHFC